MEEVSEATAWICKESPCVAENLSASAKSLSFPIAISSPSLEKS